MLALDVGVPWLLIRVLALGGLGFIVWEVKYGKLFASRAIEVRLALFVMFEGPSYLNFGSKVVRRWDGLAVCASTTRVVARCFGCPVAHKVRSRLPSGLGLSETWDNHDDVLFTRYRVIVFTQHSTVWPRVLTAGSSVRSACRLAENASLQSI